MNRTGFRNLMLITLVAVLGVSILAYVKGRSEQDDILDRESRVSRLKAELDNAARLSAALTELDSLTINEQTATQLDILRHLGLEQTDITFAIESREVNSIGTTNLYVRTVRIEGTMDYPIALGLADRLHETRKFVMTKLQLNRAQNKNNKVLMRLTGKVYGLDKVVK